MMCAENNLRDFSLLVTSTFVVAVYLHFAVITILPIVGSIALLRDSRRTARRGSGR